MAQHAKLSPSSAKRWMNCPGSVHLIGDEPNSAGHAAMLGTAVHKIIETMIDNGETDAYTYLNHPVFVHKPGEAETLIGKPGQEIPPEKLADGWFLFVMGETECDGAQMMIDEIERVKGTLLDFDIFSERYLDMTWLDSRLGGTADVTLVELFGWIHLFDYKNGRVIVEVTENEQMKNYAVGLLHEHPDAIGVHIHLVQPNAAHEEGRIRDDSFTADELRIFELRLKQAADATTPPNAPRRAGDWCTYCPANTRCAEFDALSLQEAGFDFADDPPPEPPLPANDTDVLEDDGEEYRAQLYRKYCFLPLLDGFARNVRAAVQSELLNRKAVGDCKLVRGKSNRVWAVEENVLCDLMNRKWGVNAEYLYNDPKLASPAQVEKQHKRLGITAKTLKDIVASFTRKPDGKIAVANGSDARPGIDLAALAAADFADDPIEEEGVE